MSDSGGESAASLAAEDRARANLYGLVSRLLYAPADPHLLAELSHGGPGEGEEGDTALVAAWRQLREASRRAYPAALRQEFDGLFIGVGRAEVTPYLSYYAEAGAPDRYLVRLRGQLAQWGLARRQDVGEVEDHVSGAADIMRWLIERQHPLADQRQFFESFVYPGAMPFLVAVQNAASANFYKLVAGFTAAFFDIESVAFGMDDTA